MPKNEDGEFELILGNRQLLSVFFIVVILLGVFFTMGYIVGRNSAPVPSEALNTLKEGAPAVEPAPRPAEAPKSRAESGPIETAAQKPAEAATGTAASPKAASEKGTDAGPVSKSEPVRAESAADSKAASKKDKAAKSKAAAVNGHPVAGETYLQLAATNKREADIMVDVLRTKGFVSLTSEIEERPGTFRVLVGPIAEGGVNKLRADLQESGFPGNAAIRRTF